MADRDLLQLLYVTSGVVLVLGYGPQLRRLVLHPEAGAIACPMSSWLLWTACRSSRSPTAPALCATQR